jgi:hypothetical protein
MDIVCTTKIVRKNSDLMDIFLLKRQSGATFSLIIGELVIGTKG